MIICHQCGNKILTFSNINKIRCPKCRAEYVSKSQEVVTNEVAGNISTKPNIEVPKIQEKDNEKTQVFRPDDVVKPAPMQQDQIKIGLKVWGTFDIDFLEQIKAASSNLIYQNQLKQKSGINSNEKGIFYLPKNNVLIGRKPLTMKGFEDVDIKLESSDTSISRRQSTIETVLSEGSIKVLISTHQNASNLIEINGKTVEKGIKRQVSQGDFIRFGNTIFEAFIEYPSQKNADTEKTVVYQNY